MIRIGASLLCLVFLLSGCSRQKPPLFEGYSPMLSRAYYRPCFSGCVEETAKYTKEDSRNFCSHMCQCQYSELERTVPFAEFSAWFLKKSEQRNPNIDAVIFECSKRTAHLAKGRKQKAD